MAQDRIDPRQMELARRAGSPEELLQTAEREGLSLTPEEAARAFALLHPPTGEVSDDELDAVAGGGCATGACDRPTCPRCGSTNIDVVEGLYHCIRCDYRDGLLPFIGR